jgi:hypothetical protein
MRKWEINLRKYKMPPHLPINVVFSLEWQHFFLTQVNFVTEEQKLFHSYLYENIMFTSKWDAAILGKENAWEAGWGVGKE